MAFPAKLDQIKHNAANAPGGGPHTLICKNCRKPFEWHDHISGSRNRNDDPVWTPTETSPYRYKLEYWHEDCNYPKGRYANTNTTLPQQVVVGSNNTDGWNRAPVAPTPTPATDTAPTIANEADLIAKIAAMIQGHILPQLEAVTDSLEAKIDMHIRENVTEFREVNRLVTELANNVSDITGTLNTRIAALEASRPNIIQVTINDTTTTTDVGRQHKLFNKLLARIAAGSRNIQITGPAGSGKSEAAKACAKALGYKFTLIPLISDPTDLLGYMNAVGNYVPTNFFRGFTDESPNIILLDEMDGWDARAGLAANPAMANGHCAFPHGTFERGPNTVILAATNTWGFGGNDNYVGRNKLDGTTLDRLSTIAWGYDEEFEAALAGTNSGNSDVDTYVAAVQATRANIIAAKAKIQVTPRASIEGAILLRGGLPRSEVIEARFERFRELNNWATIGKPLEDWAKA